MYNACERFRSLSYAVNDADAVEDFFMKSKPLGTSKIISMRNATRQQMLDGFQKLEDITEDVDNPCIVIFYAGHGSQKECPEEWREYATGSDEIEILCPSDIGAIGVDGKVVEGIPDRLVGTLLSNLARKRGNNIVCHPSPNTYLELETY